ncbi:MAG: HIT domain-containing protein [Candidatus Nealsonbacteria bacterium]|nr:HIT domain-containing protein [Candidatus Nealsonbacteria bacterium]
MREKLVNIKNARKGEYKKVIKEIAKTGRCPFCKENFKYHKKPIFKRRNGWFLTDNGWPYKNAENHLIILGDKHKEDFSELTKKDLESVSFLANWAIKNWKIKGGALTIRFGDTNYTGASVAHLHFHIISPKIDKKTKKAKVVNFPIG